MLGEDSYVSGNNYINRNDYYNIQVMTSSLGKETNIVWCTQGFSLNEWFMGIIVFKYCYTFFKMYFLIFKNDKSKIKDKAQIKLVKIKQCNTLIKKYINMKLMDVSSYYIFKIFKYMPCTSHS